MQTQNETTPIENQTASLIREIREVEKLAYQRDRNSPVGFLLTRQRNRLLREIAKGRGEPITPARLLHGGRN